MNPNPGVGSGGTAPFHGSGWVGSSPVGSGGFNNLSRIESGYCYPPRPDPSRPARFDPIDGQPWFFLIFCLFWKGRGGGWITLRNLSIALSLAAKGPAVVGLFGVALVWSGVFGFCFPWLGLAWLGLAWLGSAWPGSVRFGSVRFSPVRFGSVRCGSVRCGSGRLGSVGFGWVRFGLLPFASFRFASLRCRPPVRLVARHCSAQLDRDSLRLSISWFSFGSQIGSAPDSILVRLGPSTRFDSWLGSGQSVSGS